jgi:hypothetical protein
MKKCGYLLCCLFLFQQGITQILLKGKIFDHSTSRPIPFVTIGIAGTQTGALSDENGYFEFTVQHNSDSVRISAIGYRSASMGVSEFEKSGNRIIFLWPNIYDLGEVVVKPQNSDFKTLGNVKYNKGVCTAFIGENSNWRGEQAAIRLYNDGMKTLYFESFGFYIIKNEYADSLQFRLMLYEVDSTGFPGNTFLKKPIVFKTNIKQGEVRIDLRDYNISISHDFFVSLECLEEKMDAKKFCFAGSIKVPSFVKTSPYAKWIRVRGGGGDFNVKVSCQK